MLRGLLLAASLASALSQALAPCSNLVEGVSVQGQTYSNSATSVYINGCANTVAGGRVNVTGNSNVVTGNLLTSASLLLQVVGNGNIITNNVASDVVDYAANQNRISGNVVGGVLSVTGSRGGANNNTIMGNNVTGSLLLRAGASSNLIQLNSIYGNLTDSSSASFNTLRNNTGTLLRVAKKAFRNVFTNNIVRRTINLGNHRTSQILGQNYPARASSSDHDNFVSGNSFGSFTESSAVHNEVVVGNTVRGGFAQFYHVASDFVSNNLLASFTHHGRVFNNDLTVTYRKNTVLSSNISTLTLSSDNSDTVFNTTASAVTLTRAVANTVNSTVAGTVTLNQASGNTILKANAAAGSAPGDFILIPDPATGVAPQNLYITSTVYLLPPSPPARASPPLLLNYSIKGAVTLAGVTAAAFTGPSGSAYTAAFIAGFANATGLNASTVSVDGASDSSARRLLTTAATVMFSISTDSLHSAGVLATLSMLGTTLLSALVASFNAFNLQPPTAAALVVYSTAAPSPSPSKCGSTCIGLAAGLGGGGTVFVCVLGALLHFYVFNKRKMAEKGKKTAVVMEMSGAKPRDKIDAIMTA